MCIEVVNVWLIYSIKLKVINKVYGKLKFLLMKNKFLAPEISRVLCDALIQSHFDYVCPA